MLHPTLNALLHSTFEEHHAIIFNILWEMVVSSNADMKTEAANLLKVLVCANLRIVNFYFHKLFMYDFIPDIGTLY